MSTTAVRNLLADYKPIEGCYDELYNSYQEIRPAYHFFFQTIEKLGLAELKGRKYEADRILKENGVTYNIYSDPAGTERVWPFDPVPVMIESKDWNHVERGLIQRAELLDLILKDIYSSRNIIKEKIIPHSVILSSKLFLRACHDLYNDNYSSLQFLATDLSRDENGNFYVIGDRLQAPSGSGYSLENRIVLSRILPSLYRDSQVHRLSVFFRALRRNILQQSGRAEPLAVLLTPGPNNETYFEHAYLAGYLGFTLAQGEDLTVRDRTVYLKTVEGFTKVDIIFRRIDDLYLDALELKGDSLIGVPGLLEAIRAGNVKVANPPGAGILEIRSLLPYMSDLCRYFLGEDLILPVAPTVSLNDGSIRDEVFSNPEQYVIKPVIRQGNLPGYFLSQIANDSPEGLGSLRSSIEAAPHNFIAQRVLPGMSCPVLQDGSFQAARTVYRTFIGAAEGGFVVMPGGLARSSTDSSQLVVMNQTGAIGKDIWILASEPQKEVSLLLPSSSPVEILRKGKGIPSRVADNFFWMARYTERSENLTRLIRIWVEQNRMVDNQFMIDTEKQLSGILHSTGGFLVDGPPGDFEWEKAQYLDSILYDLNVTGGLAFNIRAISKSARSVRERLSDDTRRLLSRLEEAIGNQKTFLESTETLFDMLSLLSSLSSFLIENSSREAGWYFLNIGRRIERATFITRILRASCFYLSTDNHSILEKLLSIVDIRITYGRRYNQRIEAVPVLDILTFDRSNPRSLLYQIDEIQRLTDNLPGMNQDRLSKIQKSGIELATICKLANPEEILDPENQFAKLSSWSFQIQTLLMILSDQIAEEYFQYQEEQSSLGDQGGEF